MLDACYVSSLYVVYAQDMLPLSVTFVLFLVLGMVSLRGVCPALI